MISPRVMLLSSAVGIVSCTARPPKQMQMVDASVSPDVAAFADGVRRCDKDDYPACTNAAYALLEAKGVARNDMLAVQLLTRACGHVAAACNDLGELYRQGRGVDKDASKAAHDFELACNGGDQFGCANLAQMLVTGLGIPEDGARGVQLFQQACDTKDTSSCFNAGVALDNGIGGRRPSARRGRLQPSMRRRHCDGLLEPRHPSRQGDGVTKSDRAALDKFEKGCGGEIAESCRNAGVLLKRTKVPREGRTPAAFFGRACKLGDRSSCDELSRTKGSL